MTVGIVFFKKPCNTITYNHHFLTLETNLDESSCFTTLKFLLKCHHAESVSFLKVVRPHTWMSFLISLGSQPRLLLPFPRRRRCHVGTLGTLKFRLWESNTRGLFLLWRRKFQEAKERKFYHFTPVRWRSPSCKNTHRTSTVNDLLTCFTFSMSHHRKCRTFWGSYIIQNFRHNSP